MVFTQIKNPVVIDGLIKATKGLSTAQLEAFISTNKLNAAQASAILRSAGVSRAERIQILTNAGLITSNGTLTVSIKSVTTALLAQAAAWAATPMGMATIAAAGIFGLVKLIDWMTVSVEESREALAELGQEFKENESKITELNGELETTVDRIAELEGKDALTFTEAEELQNLKKQNNELEREIALLETIQRIKSKERNATFVETMEKDLANAKEYLRSHDYASSNYDVVYGDTKKYGKGRTVRTMSEMDMINSALMRREEIIEALSGELTEKERTQLETLQYEIDNYLTEKLTELNNDVESSGVSYISNPTTEDEKAVNEWLSFIDDFNDKMMIAMGTTGAKENAVNRLILGDYAEVTKDLQLLGEQGAVTADHLADPKYAGFINKCIELGIISDNSADSLGFLALAFNTVADAADGASSSTQDASEQLQTEIDTINDGIDSMQSRLSTLSDALTKLQDGSLSVNDVIDLLQQFPELATYVDLTADGFGNLEQGLRDLIKASPDDLIESLQKFKETKDLTEEQKNQIDNLCAALSDLPTDAIKDATGEFGRLAEQIKAATDAQTELEKKLAEDDYDAGYEGRVEAYGGFQEVLDAGEYGSKAYAAYKEYFGLIEKSPEQIKAWMESNKKYFTEGTDGVLAFLQTVESLSGPGGALEGIASFDAETGEFWYDINELGAFADALGWTEEMLQDFIYKYRMYCEEWESRSPADTMKELTNAGLISQIGNVDFGPTFASLKELQEYTGLGEQGVYDLIDSINELRAQEGLPNISLIGRDITEVTQTSITQWQNLGATAEEISALLIDLAQQDVAIAPNLYIDTESGPQIDVDTLLAEAGIDGSETVHIEVDFTVDGEPAMAAVEATVAEVKTILGEDWEAKLTANTVDAETGLTTVQTLLNALPASTDVLLTDSTGIARSGLSTVINLLNTVENNKTKTVTIRYQTIGMPMFAEGTSGAKAGPALLGDEYSPNGSPKPELVVSGNRAYLAGQSGPEIGYLNDGDIVYTANETKRILRGNILHKSIPAHAGGTGNGLIDNGGLSGGDYNFSGKPSGNNNSNSNKNDDEESWFERQYKDHQHWLAMDQESVDEYLKWLDEAYQKAYEEGIIDLDEYYKYQEEVYQGVQDQFKDHINDIDHEISLLEAGVGNSDEIINLSLQAMADIEAELAAARAAGLDENSDYIQWLEQQWMNYSENVTNMREQAETEAQSSIDNLVEYRIKMLKQEIQDQKDALSEKLSDLQDFYDKQRKMLQDQYDEEKYLEEQKEKRKSVTDIQSELAMLENDDSAWAQKRKLELQAELSDAEKELNSFEKDHALDMTLDMLDEQQAAQEAQIQAEMDALDEKLNDPHALFNQALADITNNTEALYKEFIEYNRQHGTGNDEDIEDLWRDAYIADLEYQDTHEGEHPDGIEIGNYTGYVVPENPTPSEPEPESEQPAPEPEPEPEKSYPYGKASDTSGVIGVGSSGTDVKAIQYALNELGFGNSGTQGCDGQFGNGTQSAVKAFQRAMGISTDGIVGKNTRAKFKAQGYATGTDNATPGWHELFEGNQDEYVFTSKDGSKYRMFSGLGDKVLNGDATNFLYNFATTGGSVLTKMLSDLISITNFGNINKPAQVIQLSTGDINISGNADRKTVSEIRRAQRENIEFVIKSFNKLNK